MRAHIRSSVIVGVAMIGISALAIAPMAPPPEPHTPPTVARDVRLTAAPALGAIPLAFIRKSVPVLQPDLPVRSARRDHRADRRGAGSGDVPGR